MCAIWQLVSWVLQAYSLVMIVYAVVSWLPSIRGRWTDYLAMAVEPVLAPVRRIIPPVGGLDLAFLIVLILIQVVNGSIVRPNLLNACLFGG